jgi:Protein of unknown function (DUF2914)
MRAALHGMMAWARTHERHLSAIAMAGGFAFDTYAFGRIDRPMTQLVFIVYLLAAGGCLAVLHIWESSPYKSNPRSHAVLVAAMQFALGALLSGFCVFYIRSAALAASWPFLLFMAAIFIGNEYFRAYTSRLVFAALLFFFTLYSYAILLVPVLLARIGSLYFLLSGVIAVAVFFIYMRVLAWLGHDRYRSARHQIAGGVLAITVMINLFYFTNIFPPLPLVLSDAGIYHNVKRTGADFQVQSEDEPAGWRALFGIYPTLHMAPGEKLYLYSAVFAPYRLNTAIEHRWEWYDPKTRSWSLQQTVRFLIQGGRGDGYRAYSFRSQPRAGDWQVNIVSFDGRSIGRKRFSVQQVAKPSVLDTKLLK